MEWPYADVDAIRALFDQTVNRAPWEVHMIVGILARLPAQCAGQENGRRKYWVPNTLEETGLGKKKIDMKKDRRSTVGVLDRVKTTGLGFFFSCAENLPPGKPSLLVFRRTVLENTVTYSISTHVNHLPDVQPVWLSSSQPS